MRLSSIDSGNTGCEGQNTTESCSDQCVPWDWDRVTVAPVADVPQLDQVEVLCRGRDSARQDNTRDSAICSECGFKTFECMCPPDSANESCSQCDMVAGGKRVGSKPEEAMLFYGLDSDGYTGGLRRVMQ